MTAPISFTGLASGIDTDSIIKQMIDVQQQPIDKLKNKTELLSLQREAMRNVNSQLLNFQNQALNLRLESTFSNRSVSSSDSSKVNATATFSAAKTTHRVKVNQLAQEATVTSNRYLSRARILGTNTVGINNLGGTSYLNAPGSGMIKGSVTMNLSDTLGSLGLSGDFTLQIDPDGSGSRSPIEITGLDASTTVGQLIDKIKQQLDSVKVQLSYDEAQGGKVLLLSSNYVGVDVGLSGAVAEGLFGITSGASVRSDSTAGLGPASAKAAVKPEELVSGTATIVSSNGRAGSITGSVDLAAAAGDGDILGLTLDDLGVTEFNSFEIDPDAGGATGNVAVFKEDGSKLTGSDTVSDLIAAINHSVPDVTAQIVAGAGGTAYLRIEANEGGRNVTLSQLGASEGIMNKVLGLGETATSTDATTDSADFTMVRTFYSRGSLTSTDRRVVSGTKEDYRQGGVTDLIDGVTVIGASAGAVFNPGSARLAIEKSEKLAIEESTQTQFFGVSGITESAYATGLALDVDASGVIGLNKAIKDLNTAGAFSLGEESGITAGSFQVGNTTLSITQDEIDKGITLAQVLARINGSNQGITLNYEAGNDRFMATASASGQAGEIRFGSYTGAAGQSNVLQVLGLVNAPTRVHNSAGSDAGKIDAESELILAGFSVRPSSGVFTINGTSIEVDVTSDSLNDIIDKINSSATGVTAVLDPNSNRISLIQKVNDETTQEYIQVGSSSDTSNLLAALHLTQGSNGNGTIRNVENPKSQSNVGNKRMQADIEVDNIHYLRNSNFVDDITPGVTYQLQGVSDSPVTISITGDTEKAIDAIAHMVVEYNKTVKLLNPAALTTDEKKYLEPITDDERSKLTYEELVQRLDKYNTYNKNETIRRDSNIQMLQDQLRNIIFTRVANISDTLNSLSSLGITTGDPGAPINADYQGVLVADSTDFDEIKSALQNNSKLTAALENDDQAVYKMFSQQSLSNVSVKGTIAYDEDTVLANDITFQVSNGVNNATITLPAGLVSRTNVLNIITNQLARNGISDIKASFDASGHLIFQSEKSSGRANIRILDATGFSETDRLSTRFGISGGSFIGEEGETRAGIAEKLYNLLSQATGVTGFLSQETNTGGQYGQGTIYDEMVSVQERITRLEDLLTQREDRLRRRFANMESVIAKLQGQQNALQQFFNSGQSANK